MLLPTHETLGTYFASVSSLSKIEAMKETYFCMLEGKQRDYIHFSFSTCWIRKQRENPTERCSIQALVL